MFCRDTLRSPGIGSVASTRLRRRAQAKQRAQACTPPLRRSPCSIAGQQRTGGHRAVLAKDDAAGAGPAKTPLELYGGTVATADEGAYEV